MLAAQENRFGFDCLLFERCNMNCDFCLESHSNNKIDYDWIRNIPQILVERYIKEEIKGTQVITFRHWGGELFFDALPDSLFDEYRNLITNINSSFNKHFPDIKLVHSWVSNGFYNNIDRVISLLKDTNSKVAISYDPVGRYKTKEQEELVLSNAKAFNTLGLLNEFSITLTKPNIEAYISGKSRINDLQFCRKFDINYYIPNLNWKQLLPSDEDLYNFFKWVVDERLFSVIDVSRVLRTILYPQAKVDSICNCDRHISACKNCLTYNCVTSSTVFPNQDFYGNKEITEQNVSKIKKNLGLLKRGCLYCNYANVCPKGCHTSILYKGYKVLECPYKKLYRYLESNPCIIEDFKKWEVVNNLIEQKEI